MTVYGKDKEIKFVEVNEKANELKVFFTDYTYEIYPNVKINVRG
jgi:hypothetical protein